MSKEKQIEEMASVLENAKIDALATIGSMNHGFGVWYAQALYNAGYRKQSESEWVMIPVDGVARYRCGNINCCLLIPFGAQPSEMAYCPNCGAKMGGGAE